MQTTERKFDKIKEEATGKMKLKLHVERHLGLER
jgi:hypothetical protein